MSFDTYRNDHSIFRIQHYSSTTNVLSLIYSTADIKVCQDPQSLEPNSHYDLKLWYKIMESGLPSTTFYGFFNSRQLFSIYVPSNRPVHKTVEITVFSNDAGISNQLCFLLDYRSHSNSDYVIDNVTLVRSATRLVPV